MEDIFNLALNQQTEQRVGGRISFFVTRVSGGWIYTTDYTEDGQSHVFVPYSDELNPNKKK